MPDPFGRLPRKPRRGQSRLSARSFANLITSVRASQSFTPVVYSGKSGVVGRSRRSREHVSSDDQQAGFYATIVGFASSGTRFSCKARDTSGAPVGDEFEVFVVSYPRVSAVLGQQQLSNCHPNLIVGDELWVEPRSVWTGESWYSGLVAEGVFILMCDT